MKKQHAKTSIVKKFSIAILLLFCILVVKHLITQANTPLKDDNLSHVFELKSPDKSLSFQVNLINSPENQELSYQVAIGGKTVFKPSSLGLDLFPTGNKLTCGDCSELVYKKIELVGTEKTSATDSFSLAWGERKDVSLDYNSTKLILKVSYADTIEVGGYKPLNHQLTLEVRAYNDGVAFRYIVPSQDNLGSTFSLQREKTSFHFAEDLRATWIPNDYDTYEWLYQKTTLSEIPITKIVSEHTHSNPQDQKKGTNTPITLKHPEYLVSIHEAALIDYADMTLVPSRSNPLELRVDLVPWPDGDLVKAENSLTTPWRVISLVSEESELLDSDLILSLNEDPAPTLPFSKANLGVRPISYVGIFWSLHLGTETWAKEGGRHGATTEAALAMIDFAAENGFEGLLVEGWNTGWETWYGEDNFDFTSPYDDFNLARVADYAKEKSIELIGHHETGGQVNTYEKRLEQAFALYAKYGIKYVKTGYAGKIRPENQYHHGQWMVRHYQKVVETAGKHGIAVIVHEPIKPTGLRRAFPNLYSNEGVRGMEWNAWSSGNPPQHHLDVAFTRGLAGPMDYTPGLVDTTLKKYSDKRVMWNELGGIESRGRGWTTVGKQLGLYSVFYSPVQMVVDLPENLKTHPSFAFFKELRTDYETSLTLSAKFGEYVIKARKVTGQNKWFIGGITNAEPRELKLDMAKLGLKGSWKARVFKDGTGAHYDSNPSPMTIETHEITPQSQLTISMAPGGGFGMILTRD